MKARIKAPRGYSACRISLKDSSPTEVDVELGSVLRIAQEVPAGTQTARWFVGDVRYILVHHTTATQPGVIPYLATTKIL